MITWADVTAIAPELATVATGTQNAILADVLAQLPSSQWGAKYDNGCKYLAAHLATVSKRGGNGPGGPVSMETVGSVSRQYAVPMPRDPILGTTPYGLEYLRLTRQLVGRIGLVA